MCMRARFTTDEIAAAALSIVDTAGISMINKRFIAAALASIVDTACLSGLSMRSLAAALGTGPMTVYNYVADKEGLEELVVAAVVADVPIPAPTDDWRHDVHAIATAMWRGVRAHPAAIPLVLTRRMAS